MNMVSSNPPSLKNTLRMQNIATPCAMLRRTAYHSHTRHSARTLRLDGRYTGNSAPPMSPRSNTLSTSVIALSGMGVSASMKNNHSALAWVAPVLRAAAIPRRGSTTTVAPSRRAWSAVASELPLSTTITSTPAADWYAWMAC